MKHGWTESPVPVAELYDIPTCICTILYTSDIDVSIHCLLTSYTAVTAELKCFEGSSGRPAFLETRVEWPWRPITSLGRRGDG